jgi:hypothetical protein
MASKKDGTSFEPSDFYFFFRSLVDMKPTTGGGDRKTFEQMDTAEQVRHLKAGFGLYVPDRFRKRVGLD